VRIRISAVAGLAAAVLTAWGGSALAAPRVTYSATVRATGQMVVSFHGDPAAGCAEFLRCDVQPSTVRWTPPSQGQLYLSGIRGRRLRGSVTFSDPDERVQTLAVVQRSAADGTHICADAGGRSSAPYTSAIVGRGGLTLGLQSRPRVFGPLTQSQLATRCGGPLPADFAADLPARRISLRALPRGPTNVDLAGSSSFSAAGLTGTVQSTVALRVSRARVRIREVGPRAPARTAPRRPPLHTIAVEYRIARVTGSMPIDVAADPRACEPLDACGLSGRLTVTPGPAHGEGYLYAYGRVSRMALRRAVGLARGPVPRKIAVFGYVLWDSARGTITSALDRNGTPACRDSAPLPSGALELRVRRRRVTAQFGSGGVVGFGRQLLQTRCPGPLLADLGRSTRLAVGRTPRRALARKTLRFNLNRGARASTASYHLRSRPDLTMVLEREGVEEVGGTGFVVEEGGGGVVTTSP
jgi:hypothetical protein